MNWSKVGTGDQKPLLKPSEIYNALPRKPWSYLRHEQGQVLDRWFDRRDEQDLVIKQNTGGGKTAVGLLIARSTMNEGIGPTVYLTPDNYLARQVSLEAAKLHIPTTDNPKNDDFRSCRALLVSNYQKLINGMSVFGVIGDDREKINLGLVVVDDAHAALTTTESQFRLVVPADHEAYGKLFKLFKSDLKDQSSKTLADILAKDYTATMAVPFWAWIDKQDEVMSALHPHGKEDGWKFVWPLIGDVLHLCTANVTSRGIEIRPPCLPISSIPAFAKAKRRVYLTATLADDSPLITDLDADPDGIAKPVSPVSAADLGDRMILAPLALNTNLDSDAVRQMAREFADGDRDGDGVADSNSINVVVLVPSEKAAEAWSPFADKTHTAKTLEAGVRELVAGHVGLVVLINKYDGVDLPGDACRMLILDGVPRPMDAAERRESSVLSGSPMMLARQVQRIEQGMGRGVRDSEDYCAVLLLGSELAVTLNDAGHRALLSPATRMQVETSRDVADQIRGEGLDAIRETIIACLDQDEQWVTPSRRALAKVGYATHGHVRPDAIATRKAFDLAVTRKYKKAADQIQIAINTLEDPVMRGWLGEQKAAYLHHVNAAAAQQALAAALNENPLILRPAAGVEPIRIKMLAEQARQAAKFLKGEYKDPVELVLGVQALLDRITWEKERTEEAEAAWEALGTHLGFISIRPESRYGEGPDNLWALGDDRYAVTELKTGTDGGRIAKSDLDQLGGSVRWNDAQQPGGTSIPVMLNQNRTCHHQGTPVADMRVITPAKLEQLKRAVKDFITALADGMGTWGDHLAVSEQLKQHKLTGTLILDAFSETAVKGKKAS